MKNKVKISISPIVLSALIIAVFVVCILIADKKFDGQRQENLEKAIFRSAVSCYAIEGFYPPSVSYLEENYGLIVDRKNFTVYYEVYGSNIQPDVTVLRNKVSR